MQPHGWTGTDLDVGGPCVNGVLDKLFDGSRKIQDNLSCVSNA